MEKTVKPKRREGGGFLRGMLDGWRSSVGSVGGSSGGTSGDRSGGSQGDPAEVVERLRPTNFEILKIVRHGFPYQPTALAFDPIQRLIAIGNKNGSLRILGRPGVDIHVQHIPEYAVIQLIFIINEGTLISVCADDSIHMWDIKHKQPEIVHSLKFARERITFVHVPFQSKWLYIGTERGNTHVANIESFLLSGYVINWNKAIELSRKTHPGAVIHISDCPVDPNKLLIGFDSGTIVLWDLRNKTADTRITYPEGLKSISWHHEGRQFLCSHNDGSLTTWNVKATRPVSVVYPHAKNVGDETAVRPSEPCKPLFKVQWRTVRNGDSFIIFSGGLPYSSFGGSDSGPSPTPSDSKSSKAEAYVASVATQSLTVIHGKTTTVLEMESHIIDFITLCESPWESDFNEPYAIVVLLNNDLVVVDLTSTGYPCFQNPYTMDLHESPITYCFYLADGPSDLIPAFYSVGFKGNAKRSGFSEKEWPLNGGEWGSATLSYPELIITGHADGTLKFWDSSSVNLHLLYKLKTSKLFEKPKARPPAAEGAEKGENDPTEDPFAIDQIAFCAESRTLSVAGASAQVIVFRFSKHEANTEVPAVEVVMNYEVAEEKDQETETIQGISGLLKQGSSEEGQRNSVNYFYPLSVKAGQHKRPSGFQPELVCLSPWLDLSTPPYKITCLTVNSSANLLAYGNANGLVIIDMIQRCPVLNVGSHELYGTADPYQRFLKSPKRNQPAPGFKDSPDGDPSNQSDADRTKSPTSEQVNVNSSFSRSRSSSISSLENGTTEAVQCLVFAETFTTKADPLMSSSLWVGTSLGSVIVVSLTLPETNDDRVLCLQSVLAVATGNVFRLKGSIQCISFLDNTGLLLASTTEPWKTSVAAKAEERRSGPTGITRSSSSGGSVNSGSKISPTSSSTDIRDSQYVVLVSEKQARVLTLPSQVCAFKATLSETSFVVRADVIQIKTSDSVCLATYLGTGNIVAYSLPSLKPLIDIDFLPLVDVRIARTLSFSTNGHGMYMASPMEISKFTISSAAKDIIPEMSGTLFIAKELPEPPKQSFFKGLLFGAGPSILDREELFGELASGKGSKTTAKVIQGPIGLIQAQAAQGTVAAEMAKVRQGLQDRGENLEKLEDRTARMMSESEGYKDTAHQLLNKYRDRKWYQF